MRKKYSKLYYRVLSVFLTLCMILTVPGVGTMHVHAEPQMDNPSQTDTVSGLEEGIDNPEDQEGDILQLSYVCADPEYALIVSVDGNGIVTPHFPEDSTDSSLLERGGEHPLSYSYVLDDAPSFERFYLVTCDEEFSLDSIEDFLLSISGISGKIDVEELSDLVGSKVSISDIMLLK